MPCIWGRPCHERLRAMINHWILGCPIFVQTIAGHFWDPKWYKFIRHVGINHVEMIPSFVLWSKMCHTSPCEYDSKLTNSHIRTRSPQTYCPAASRWCWYRQDSSSRSSNSAQDHLVDIGISCIYSIYIYKMQPNRQYVYGVFASLYIYTDTIYIHYIYIYTIYIVCIYIVYIYIISSSPNKDAESPSSILYVSIEMFPRPEAQSLVALANMGIALWL